MGRIGINEKELRRVEALVRANSKELKVADAASLLRSLCQVPVLSEAPSEPAIAFQKPLTEFWSGAQMRDVMSDSAIAT